MDFSLSEEDELLRKTVREFCDAQVRPNAEAWDGARALPSGLLGELGEMGLLAMELSEDLGGAELSTVAATALVGELASADGALASLVSDHNTMGLACAAKCLQGPARDEEVSAMAGGAHLVATVVGERSGVRARPSGDGWELTGEARHVLGAADASRLVVFANGGDADAAFDPGAVVALLVDANATGVAVGERVRTLGMRAAGTAHVQFDGVQVSAERRLADPGQAWSEGQALLDRKRIDMAAIACGIGRGALAVAVAYANERQQFGRPIAKFQAIQWKLADMATNLESAWLMTLHAAWLRDRGQPFAAAAGRAKLKAAVSAKLACTEALQIHGGYGYTREFPVERALRDARCCELAGETNEHQRSVVSQSVLGRFAP